jgi:hypothetical protein
MESFNTVGSLYYLKIEGYSSKPSKNRAVVFIQNYADILTSRLYRLRAAWARHNEQKCKMSSWEALLSF